MLTPAQRKKIELQKQKLLVAKKKREAELAKQKETNEKDAAAIRQERNTLADIERKIREAFELPVK